MSRNGSKERRRDSGNTASACLGGGTDEENVEALVNRLSHRSVLQTYERERSTRITSTPKIITSVHFRLRARHYRLAAAISDTPRDVAMFCDLAWTFERLSERFARAEARPHSP